jgi:flagellar operon protein
MEMDSSRISGTNAAVGSPSLLRGPVRAQRSTEAGLTFRDVLRKNQPPGFSAHALARLRSRRIQLTAEELGRLNDAVERVAAKGGREALFVMKHHQGEMTGFLVSVKNRVVITAVDEKSLRENVFTNIDSAAII